MSNIIKECLQAGLDAQSWPKDLADYQAQLRAQGDSFRQTPGSVAFRLYFKIAANIGESQELRESVYAAFLGEMMGDKMNNQLMQERLTDPERRNDALNELGAWMVDTCVELGCTTEAAYTVAHVFVESLQAAREERDPAYRMVWMDAGKVSE